MGKVSSLADRIDAEFAAADQRVTQLKTEHVQAFEGRKQRLEQLRNFWSSCARSGNRGWRLSAKKFGERVNVQPHVEPGRRSATFAFKSDLARIDLRFAVTPRPGRAEACVQLRFGNHPHSYEIRFAR